MISNPADRAFTLKQSVELAKNYTWDISSFYTRCSLKGVHTTNKFILDDYKEIFEQVLIEKELDSKYYFNPGLLAYDLYGSQNLDFLVMYFSGIYTVIDFNKPIIKVLPASYLTSINKIIMKHKAKVDNSKRDPQIYNDITIYEN